MSAQNVDPRVSENEDTQCCYYYRETNPLLIDTVLYHLVEFMGFEDLKTCRLVHSSWNWAITPRLRTCNKVVFRPVSPEEVRDWQLLAAQDEKSCLQGVCRSQVANGLKAGDINDRVSCFTEMLIQSLDMFGTAPFSEFKLIDFPFESDIGTNFFNICGQFIQSVDIRVNRKRNERTKLPTSFGGDFYPSLLSVKTPFLKKLVIFPFPGLEKAEFTQILPYLEGMHFKEWASKELLYPHSFLENIFTQAVRLHEIWISIGLENCKSVENILIALGTSGRYSFLTRLHIAYLRLSHLEILQELALQKRGRLRLTSFRIEALAHDVPTSMFEAFLRSQSVNMEELYCRRFMGVSKFGKFTFPRMLGLKHLDCELSARQVMPLRCNTRFPRLRKLNLFGTCCQVFTFEQQFCGNKVSNCLTNLHFRPGVIVKGSISALADNFPCLRSLTLSITSCESLKELLQCWETLEDLELYFADGVSNIDSILTGIPVELCARLIESQNWVLDLILQSSSEYLPEGDVSLTNFKNLKTLHLEYNAFLMSRDAVSCMPTDDVTEADNQASNGAEVGLWEESYLPTNVTGYFALNHMRSLRKISLPECKLTEECCKLLVQNLDLVSWTFCSEGSNIVPPRKT